MCRNIKPLFNFDPPASSEEIHSASLQFVRKLSGFNNPSKVNEKVFYQAVRDVQPIVGKLLKTLKTNAQPKDREEEAERAHLRAIKRFGKN